MSGAKRSPGEWATPGTDDGARVISFNDRKGKRRTLAHVYGRTDQERDANAALVVAAPVLLEYAESYPEAEHDKLSELLEDSDAPNDDIRAAAVGFCSALAAYEETRTKAIAKARGTE